MARENKIKEELQCKFIRINPDRKDYDIFLKIGKIHNHIVKSVKEKVKYYYKETMLSYCLACKKKY